MLRLQRIILALAFAALAGPANALPDHSPKQPREGQHQGPQGATPTAKPEFVIAAEKDLENAELALKAEQKLLTQIRQEEATLRQAAIFKTGSWIEPTEMWKRKQIVKESLEIKQQAVINAKRRLTRAENQALAITGSNWTRHHRPSWFRSWWQW